MGERKVLNKYYPPDFDPSKIPRRRLPKDMQVKVRIMLPMSIRCNACGEYMYQAKKFNAKKETVQEITMKTDPKNSDYVVESGASRNFEAWRETNNAVEEAKAERAKEEEGDAMKALENRTKDSKMEMDILDALDEIKAVNARHHSVDTEKVLEAVAMKAEKKMLKAIEDEEKEIEKEVEESFKNRVHRLDDDEENDEELLPKSKKLKSGPPKDPLSVAGAKPQTKLQMKVQVVKKGPEPAKKAAPTGLAGLSSYVSSSDED